MPNPPTARICHLTTRRIRVRIPDKRGDAAFFDDIVDRFSRWHSVERVEANPLTASILVYCSDPQQLLAEITARNDLLAIDFVAEQCASETLRNRAAQHFGSADAALRRWTEGELDIRGLLFLLYLVGGVYQLSQGRVSASAPSLLWRAGSLIGLWDVWPVASSRSAHRADPVTGPTVLPLNTAVRGRARFRVAGLRRNERLKQVLGVRLV
jgi:hypothetical protein